MLLAVSNYGDFQMELYVGGLAGVRCAHPMSFAELEARASMALSTEVLSYVAGGAGNEYTQDVNVTAFEKYGLIPRMLRGAADRDLSIELFGMTLPSPLMLAPVGVIGLCAQDGHGDQATARASARTGVPMIASTLSVDPMEVVAPLLGDTPASFSSTRRRIVSSRRVLSRVLKQLALRASSSRWTRKSSAGVRGTWRWRRFPS